MTNEELSAALEHCKSDAGRDSCADLALRCHKAESENARLAALVESGDKAIAHCVQGAKELGESLADAVKRIEWLELLAHCVCSGRASVNWQQSRVAIVASPCVYIDCEFEKGIPRYSEPLSAALLAALSPTPTPAEQRPGEAKV